MLGTSLWSHCSPHTVHCCEALSELTTKHLTLFWVGPVKCHIISLYTSPQLFSFSVWLHYKGWNITFTTAQMVTLESNAWVWRILVLLRSTMQFKYARVGCSCCQRGFESKESCRWQAEAEFGLGPDLSSIDTYLQFLCIPHSSTFPPLTRLSYIHKCILHCFLYMCPVTSPIYSFFYFLFLRNFLLSACDSWSSAFLLLSVHVQT